MEYLSWEPPLHDSYRRLFDNDNDNNKEGKDIDEAAIEECELPLIDLRKLNSRKRAECMAEIAEAARDWGFFQVVGHGVPLKVLDKMRSQQVQLFRQPFHVKTREDRFLNLSTGSYRWGTPAATRLSQFSWSEAFHVPLTDLFSSHGVFNSSLSSSMKEFATRASDLAKTLAEILAEKMGQDSTFIEENCWPSTCYVRMNRYPPCPVSSKVSGIVPHTDSDFLTVLYQDQVGGLQLVNNGKWFAVKPNPKVLIINVGDLFQAWSNGVYKSVQHRVVTNSLVERFSTAYFLCPSYDTVIRSCCEPSVYRDFSFREYRQQVQEDVRDLGFKVGLPRFLI